MCRHLQQQGWDVRVRLFHWGSLESGIVYQGLQSDGIQLTSHAFAGSESNVRWLLKSVISDPPAVLIADNVVPALLAGRYLQQGGIPTIGILRSDDAFYHAVLERFVRGKREDRLSAVVGVSQFLTNIVRSMNIESLDVVHIPSGTPLSDRTATAPTDTLKLVYVGRLVQEQKRIIETTHALHRVVSELPNTSATLFGDGSEHDDVKELLTSMSSPVELAGRLDSDGLRERLRQSHAIVLLSDYEGTPTAVMEAMACGVPVVCTNTGGMPCWSMIGEMVSLTRFDDFRPKQAFGSDFLRMPESELKRDSVLRRVPENGSACSEIFLHGHGAPTGSRSRHD